MNSDPRNFGLVLLAAGASRRFGSPKQLVDLRGEPLIRHQARTSLDAGFSNVTVVLGAHHAQIAPFLDDLPIEIIVNNLWTTGMGSSIRLGVSGMLHRNLDGIVLLLGDQPKVTAKHLRQLVQRYSTTRQNVACSLAGEISPPALFGRSSYPQLVHIEDNSGAKALLRRDLDLQTLECPEAFCDLDTKEDLKYL